MTNLGAQFSLILPTLNERENIVPQIQEAMTSLPDIGQIIVVDDNSKDGTREAIEREFEHEIREGKILLRVRTRNRGLAPSLQEGVNLSTLNYVGWMDCDLSMPTSLIPEMLAKLEQGYDICVGSRFVSGGEQKKLVDVQKDSRTEILFSNLLNKTLKQLIRVPISDFTSGFIVAKRQLIAPLTFHGKHGEYFLDLMIQASRRGAKITELPYVCGNRKFGKSKTAANPATFLINCFRLGKTVLKAVRGENTGLRSPTHRK